MGGGSRTWAVAGPAAAAAVGVGLVVIAALLAVSLPTTHSAVHWSVAWAGLDVATATCALVTALLLRAGDPRAALSATAGAAMLALDAWFDVCTAAPGTEHAVAVGEAVLVELPLAALGLHLATTLLRDQLRNQT